MLEIGDDAGIQVELKWKRNLMLTRGEESVRFGELVGGRDIASAKRGVKA